MLNKLSIRHQFAALGAFGVVMTLVAIALGLLASYQIEVQSRKSELRALVSDAVHITGGFVGMAEKGTMPQPQAKSLALKALGAARFDHGNYYFVDSAKGIGLQHVNKALIGTNRYDAKDMFGNYTDRVMINSIRAGHPAFAHYFMPKAGSSKPQPKISFMGQVPGWGWYIGTGAYVDDIDAQLWKGVSRFSLVFVPLFALFLIAMYLMQRNVNNTLRAITSAMTQLSRGEFETSIPFTDRKDEIGGMARAVEVFKSAGIEKAQLEAEAAHLARTREAERLEAEARREAAASQLAHVLDAVAGGLEELAAGHLTYRLTEAFGDDYDRLRNDFNAALDRLQEAMGVVAANATAIRSGASEISAAADDLSRRTEQQAATLEETAAALEEITATVRRTADAAVHARNVVGAAQGDAERGGAVVSQAVAAMGEIEASSKQIGSIIGVIDEIAFQTNLLALNAGVEAARAGDAGRGFAVVASEVRALAQRSADAAKEIKTLISASNQQVVAGVDLVGQTGRALERIVGQIGEINGVVAEIAASAQEQSTGLVQVNTAVGQMDQTTQQNAAMVEESTAASHSLAREAEQLSGLMARFDLGAVAHEPAMPRPATSARPAASRAAPIRPAQTATRPVKPAPLREAQMETAGEDNWEDF